MGFFRPMFQGRTYRHLVYLSLAFPLGVTYFVFLVTGLSVGAGLVVIWVGIPILIGMMLAWRGLGAFERGLHRAFLDIDIPDPPSPLRDSGPLWPRIRRLLSDGSTWRVLFWLFLRFPAGIVTFSVLVAMGSAAATLIASPLLVPLDWILVTPVDFGSDWILVNGWTPTQEDVVWLVPLGFLLLVLFFHVVNGLAWLFGIAGEALLGPSFRERTVELETRATEAEVRTRLAHELHDSIGHAVTLMVVQAGAGRKVFDDDPGFARESLEIIERTGRTSLGELDRVLGVLRDDGAAAIEPPAPDLSDLDALVTRVREADIPVSLDASGDLWVLPHDLQTAAYRVVQEALTNVMRHAGSPTAVSVRLRPAGLEVEVVNGPAVYASPRRPGIGRGIIGIRERAAAFGGSSEIGPTAEGGYRVWVRFPLP